MLTNSLRDFAKRVIAIPGAKQFRSEHAPIAS
ncbi:MAG: hypothetical protein ACI9VX_002548, partial [Dinoroseobacter sp.]